jgi:hypothetical protein
MGIRAMFAHRLATCCLLSVSIVFARSQTDPGEEVMVYLEPGDSVSPAAMAEAKVELASLMHGMGVHVDWWDSAKSPGSAPPGASLIVADFKGTCSVPERSPVQSAEDVRALPALADTSISDGHILPFAHVNCEALSRFIGPILAHQPGAQWERLLGRAIGRLLAHETYHIVVQTRDHASSGIAKAGFSTADLLAERFEFEPAAMAKLHQPPLAPLRVQAPAGF